MEVLSIATPDDFYEIFKTEKGWHLPDYVNAGLRVGRIGGDSEKEQGIAENATIALKKIANESEINRLRVSRFGIKVDDE